LVTYQKTTDIYYCAYGQALRCMSAGSAKDITNLVTGGLSHVDLSQNSALTFLSVVLAITENGQPLMCNFTSDICHTFLAQQSGIK
jgi:hypothetical protein